MSDIEAVEKLRTMALTGQTFRAAITNAGPMAKAMIVPWLLTVAFGMLTVTLAGGDMQQMGQPGYDGSFTLIIFNLIGGLAAWYFMMAYAVACHRINLIGSSGTSNFFGIGFSKREWRFIGYSFAVSLIPIAPIMIVTAGALMLDSGLLMVVLIPLYLFALVIILRFMITLPMIAVDGPTGLRSNLGIAWNLMRGSTFAFFLASILINLPFLVLFMILIAMSAALSFFGETMFPMLAINYLGNFVSVALTATLLSVSFRTLTGFEAGEADHE